MRVRAVLTLVLALLLGSLIATSSADAAWPGQNGKVVFFTWNGCCDRIWTVNPDGTGLRKILEAGSQYAHIEDMAPDGQSVLAFDYTYRTLQTVPIDPPASLGGGTVLATLPNPQFDAAAVYSWDGARIAYLSRRWAYDPVGTATVWVMNRDGSSKLQLATGAVGVDITELRWSPDGSTLAYLENGIWYEVPSTGGLPVQSLAPPPASPGRSPISPDGTKKVFVDCCDPDTGTNPQVYVSNLDGSGRVRLTAVTEPEWSPQNVRWQSIVDSTPPSAPSGLAASAVPGKVTLSWSAATDDSGVSYYNVHRGTTADFEPTAANRLVRQVGTTYVDATAPGGTVYYKVTAQDASSNVGPAAVVSVAVPVDTTPPTVTITAPVAGGTVTGVATVRADASDDTGVGEVRFSAVSSLGLTPFGTDTQAPYIGVLGDQAADDGPGTIIATAVDFSGNTSTTQIAVTYRRVTTPPSNLTAAGAYREARLSWTAASDPSGIDLYLVHRATTPGFTPSAANLIAQQTGTSYTDAGLAPGTYYYKVRAREAWNHAISLASNEASAVVTDGSAAPTVAFTAPADGATVQGTVALTASASDDLAVSGVQFKVDGANLGAEDASAPYTVDWDTTAASNGPHTLAAVARDGSGNSTSTQIGVVVGNGVAPAGLVAAYGFDESGTAVGDASGSGNNGTISGATRTAAGKYGGALSFDGVNDSVSIADSASLDLTTGMTLEAWVQPTATNDWRTVLLKERSGGFGYALYGGTDTNRPGAFAEIGSEREARGTAALAVNAWTHLAATYDGAQLRLYVNGAQAASLAVSGSMTTTTGALKIGGNAVWGEWFKGLIDEVRVYSRALTAAEIQADMNRPLGAPDTQAPTAPGNLAATGAIGRVSLTWSASTDNAGVTRYNVHRATTAGFTPSAANRIGQPTGTSYTDAGLAAGTYYYRVTAEDGAGNVSASSSEASAAATVDSTPPTVSITAPAAAATVSATIDVTAGASDNVGVASVQFRLDGAALGAPDTTAPYSVSWDTRTAANGPHTLTAVATDTTGLASAPASVSVIVDNSVAVPPAGVVAAYGFEEGAGTAVADASGRGNNGTISGATWSTAGKNGKALSFDGVNDSVSVPDANSLDLTTGMTLEAWVRPTALGSAWRTVLFKEQPGNLVYGLYAGNGSAPSVGTWIGGAERTAAGTGPLPLNAWSHVAATYDGASLRLYVNGALVRTTSIAGALATSSGVLRIGGNGVWPEWFKGLIDDVRVYDQALSATEIQADMSRGV
jgi:Concanavalin A-like lectin/glucanases superfamily/Bacterial Ig domain